MLYATTSILEGYEIQQYLGIVAGEAIMGADVFKDISASITDFFGGRSTSYEEQLREAKEIALEEVTRQTEKLGGNAIVGMDLDYETLRGSMLMVSVSGTAVVVIRSGS